MSELSFYKGKRVFVTGHTGFKGSWMCRLLTGAGAQVTGYSVGLPTDPALFELADIGSKMASVTGDIADLDTLRAAFEKADPEIVIHMAAQPLVREGYSDPVYTYRTNVMGTVNILECVRLSGKVRSFVNVTTDKVYKNNEWCWGYRETDELCGQDPYSNSKSCSELVTSCYKDSFFQAGGTAISAVRAGNVIGGGDFADFRIIPDCVRAVMSGQKIGVRNPFSVRPYQHVLEPIAVYLDIAAKQYEDGSYAGTYNAGPDSCDCITTGELVALFCKHWGGGVAWTDISEKNAPHESGFLKLDSSKLKAVFGWKPRWNIDRCMEYTTRFYKAWIAGEDLCAEMDRQINDFLEG